jgi:lysophospholipase L1-like esterase
MWWGDYTHPSSDGAKRVADQLVKFIKPLADGGSPFVQAWIQQ